MWCRVSREHDWVTWYRIAMKSWGKKRGYIVEDSKPGDATTPVRIKLFVWAVTLLWTLLVGVIRGNSQFHAAVSLLKDKQGGLKLGERRGTASGLVVDEFLAYILFSIRAMSLLDNLSNLFIGRRIPSQTNCLTWENINLSIHLFLGFYVCVALCLNMSI